MLLIYQVSWKSTTSGENPLPGPHDLGSDQWEALGIKSHRAGLETHTALCIHMCIFTPIHTHYIIHTMRAYAVSSVMSGSLQPIWTAACQAPLSMKLSRQEHWSG